MVTVKSSFSGLGAAAVAVVVLTGCSKFQGGEDEMAWARAALERNPRIEVVAADQDSKSFTVRLKDTGDLQVVRVDQLMAGPAASGPASGQTAAAGASQTAASGQAGSGAAEQTASNQAPPSGSSAPAGGTATTSADTSANSDSAAARPASGAERAASSGPQGASPGDQGATAGDQAAAAPRVKAASSASPGEVLASGPGFTIKTANTPPTHRAAVVPGSGSTAKVERHHDPIVCQGDRLLHIDNRNLEFDGDAVRAEDGCEIHITNSRISAKGVGISARKASVHIDNSQIEGDGGSVDAEQGAQVFAASSTFKGLRRRLDDAVFHDLGGNVWN
jgi:hypothetical protein